MDADFGIVAVTWPGQADAVSGLLEDATRIDIEDLERNEILRIVEEAGVAGPPELQRLIVDQAQGVPGSRSCSRGHASLVTPTRWPRVRRCSRTSWVGTGALWATTVGTYWECWRSQVTTEVAL